MDSANTTKIMQEVIAAHGGMDYWNGLEALAAGFR
jgi:hypothetical protein